MDYALSPSSRDVAIKHIARKRGNQEKYSGLISTQLRNMKAMGMKSVRLNADRENFYFTTDYDIYGYNIRPKYGYDVYGDGREKMIDSLWRLLEGSELSFQKEFTDELIKQELQNFLALYTGENPPDLLMPRLFENEMLRNMRRKMGRSFDAQMVLEDGHPTWEYFKKNFLEKKDNL